MKVQEPLFLPLIDPLKLEPVHRSRRVAVKPPGRALNGATARCLIDEALRHQGDLIKKGSRCRDTLYQVLGTFVLATEDIKIIGIRHGEKMYETLLTNEECAKAIDLSGFYRVPADNRGLNYDKYFKEGETERNVLTEFNSNNTRLLNVEETKAKIASLEYIQERLNER